MPRATTRPTSGRERRVEGDLRPSLGDSAVVQGMFDAASPACREIGVGFGCDVVRVDFVAAVLAGEARVGDLPTGLMAQHDRWTFRAGEMGVAPAHERDDGRKEVASGRCQPVFVAVGIGGVEDPLEQAGVDEGPQPGGERWPGDVEVAGELPVAPYAEERLAQNEQGPAFADQGERPPDGLAFESVREVIGADHGSTTLLVQ